MHLISSIITLLSPHDSLAIKTYRPLAYLADQHIYNRLPPHFGQFNLSLLLRFKPQNFCDVYGIYFIFKIGIKINDWTYMLAKIAREHLQDSQLIKIFLNFVQAYRLQYEKVHKEISYKFYEATWTVGHTRATGYGRTETDAYKSALKNLIEVLISDARYADHFASALSRLPKNNLEKAEAPPQKAQIRTEGDDLSNEGHYKCLNAVKERLNSQSSKKSLSIKATEQEDYELEEAKGKMRLLQAKLALVLEQNRVLKSKLGNGEKRESLTKISDGLRQPLRESTNLLLNRSSSHFQRESVEKSSQSMISNTFKLSVPKLNLNVLPNYHKKSEKCLNDALLEAYHQKHGVQTTLCYD